MVSGFKKAALVGRYQSEGVAQSLLAIADFLRERGVEVLLDSETAQAIGRLDLHHAPVNILGERVDLAIAVGGDGTMLGVGRQLARHGVPLVGINQGRLGFITDIPLDAYATVLPPMLAGQYVEDFRTLMHARVVRDGHCVFDALAMNDVVVNRGATSGMVELRVEVDGHFVSNQRADGLIVASPTGSTAYALSAGGPMLHPGNPSWVMVPIAPHTLSNRPLVLPDHVEIAIELVSGRDASANFDMQSLASLLHGDRITVRRSQHRVRFLHPRGWTWFDTLRKKLHWNEGA